MDGTAKVVSIPTDSTFTVLSGPNQHGKLHEKGMVYVLWEEQTVALFAVDVEARGVEVRPPEKSGRQSDKSATA